MLVLVFNSEGAFVLELDMLLFFFEVVLAVTVGPFKLLDLDLEFTFAVSVTMVLVMTVGPLL